MTPPLDRAFDSLDPVFRPLAMALVARCVEAGIQVCIVNTRRTAAQQQDAIARGVSWVQRSKHQDGLAIDLCPYDVWQLNGSDKLMWEADQPVWQQMGAIGERLGLRWGGRWQQRDLGHFEYVPPTGGSHVSV